MSIFHLHTTVVTSKCFVSLHVLPFHDLNVFSWLFVSSTAIGNSISKNNTTRTQFHNHLIQLKFNPKYFMQNSTYFRQLYQKCWKQYMSLYTGKHQLYLLEQHSESYEIWSATIRINTDGKSLNMKLGPQLDFISKYIHSDLFLTFAGKILHVSLFCPYKYNWCHCRVISKL